MKTNQLVLGGIVAALGIAGAVYLTGKPTAPATTKAEVPTKPAPAVAAPDPVTQEAAPVAPEGPRGAVARGEVALALGVTEAQIAARPLVPALGSLHTSDEIQAGVAKMVELAGGEAKMRPLLAAKWKLTVSALTRTIFLEMTTDLKGTVRVRDEQTGTVRYRSGKECRVERGASVLPCRREDRMLMAALYAGERAVVPLRFTKEQPKETREDTGGYFDVENGETDTIGVWIVDRQLGTVAQVGPTPWADLRFENRSDFLGVQIPSVWLLRVDLSAPAKAKNGTGFALVQTRHPSVLSVRVQSVEPVSAKSTIAVPALTSLKGLRLEAQAEQKVLAKAVNGVAKVGDAIDDMVAQIPFELLLDSESTAVLAPPFLPVSPGRSAEARIAFPMDLLLTPALAAKTTVVPADANVVRVVRRFRAEDLNDALGAAYAEVKAAGYEFGKARTVMRPLSDEMDDEMWAEFQIPVEPKGAK